ncbi:hypothetical protein DVK44_18380 [Streptomyces paludis]|uniref:Uncharacterized protein n=1 Tax=Streptomyces paludis TaxID=2282738 RepID=A0A345HRH2_9ACTN|nr:hypothetical protein DVK44_18380 [Streptomyces paludis]
MRYARPERDIREVPWWRVRTLRSSTTLAGTVLGLGGAVAQAAVGFASNGGGWALGLQRVVFCAFFTAVGLHSLHRLLRHGAPTARRLQRAGRAPVPVPRRYVLLHDPDSGGPLLLLFPAHGGDSDQPEALLGILAPGPAGRPWTGLPVAPVGTAELRGWLDAAPTVVPWIDGRPLWPRHPYRQINPGDPETRTYLERLAPPSPSPYPNAPASASAPGTTAAQGDT